ncbi:MAG: FHA domain-containing protein, partial [Myxococcota bacterium]
MISLEIVEGSTKGQSFRPTDAVVTIGRADSNTVVLSDYHLSGEHGQIFLEAEQYIYRDLRSTNGSMLVRGDQRLIIDADSDWEIALRNGDQLRLGDPNSPVVIAVHLATEGGEDSDIDRELSERLIASRSIVDLPAVTDRVEHDPVSALRVYKALQPLSSRLDMNSTLEAVVEAVFELLPQATHVAVLLRSETDLDRFTVALSRQRTPISPGADNKGVAVRASRAVLRRVLAERAAMVTANASEDLGASESIMGGRILSIIAVPLWRGDEIRGLIQADNRSSAGMFEERDLEVALLLGAQAALAVDNAALVSRLRIAEERLRGENTYLKRREENLRFESIIGESAAMKSVLGQLQKVLNTRATVCVEGETGTGKELIASAI